MTRVPPPPLWRESLLGLELASLLRDPVFRGRGVADGQGQPVLLIPGFLAGDDSLRLMGRWLKRSGHYPFRARVRANIDCWEQVVPRLERRLELVAERQGQRAAVIGQSRGGSLAKVLAVRRPDLVSGVVTLGSPVLDPLAVHPLVGLQVLAVGTLGSLGVPGLFGRGCLDGECCTVFREQNKGPLPPGVGYVSIYSKRDGIVDWRACLDPGAEQIEIRSSHCGMAVHPDGYRAIARALAGFRRSDARARPSAPAVRLRKAA